MARQVIFTQNEPNEIKIGDETLKICMCGLSKTFPICDGSEEVTKDEMEGVIYQYDDKGNKIGAFMEDEEAEGGCCGGGCCGGGCHSEE